LNKYKKIVTIKLTLGESAEVQVSAEAARTSYPMYSAVVLKAAVAN